MDSMRSQCIKVWSYDYIFMSHHHDHQLRDIHGAAVKVAMPVSGSKAPDYIFENLSVQSSSLPPAGSKPSPGEGPPRESHHAARSSSSGSLLAWHGTSFERLHSIISTGLQPASGTRLQRNGANHGEGIYLRYGEGI